MSAHDSPIVAVVVTFESGAVIERCLRSLQQAAPAQLRFDGPRIAPARELTIAGGID